jgi:2-succinyl-5-enolpyruvyl-6-hydroxy-3-cyclohexene-1-carboxylate synthase
VPAHGAIVCGRDEHGSASATAVAAAGRLGWPLLADALSPARADERAIATYDLLLRDPGLARALAPDYVVRVGDLPTSKPLRTWLAGLSAPQLALQPWQDPDAVVSELAGIQELEALRGDAANPRWLAAWQDADRAAGAALRDGLAAAGGLTEPGVAAALGEWLDPQDVLFVAASMPIRDVELYLPATRPLPRVLANRGANGIDGTISAAFGVAAAGGARRVVLLIGDVATAHDAGGLLAASRLGLEVTIVLLNNDGGGIFHFLPVAGEGAAFAEHVATPHGIGFAAMAGLYGLGYERPDTLEALRDAVARGGSRLIEVRTDRAENLALHRRLAEAALAAVRSG